MSKYYVTEFVDDYIDSGFEGTKDTNVMYIRSRFLKLGAPVGNMKMQIWDSTKTTMIAESANVKCDFVTDSKFVGTTGTYAMSWIRFDFGGQALRANTKYYARVVVDSTYISGRDASNYLTAIFDYPKPTNDNGVTSLELEGRNFQRYPSLLLQVFGIDYGEK